MIQPMLADVLTSALLGAAVLLQPPAPENVSTGSAPAAAAPSNPLQETIAQMRAAQARLATGDAGEQTRAIQQKIVEQLGELIRQAQQPPPENAPASSQSAAENRPQPADQSQGKPEDPQQEAAPAPQPRHTQDKPNPEESSELHRQPRDSTVQLVPRERLLNDIWGHLPPAVRDRLLNVYSEQYLPQYEDLVRRYFEVLAEQGRSSRGRP